jgi:hypothetical protein
VKHQLPTNFGGSLRSAACAIVSSSMRTMNINAGPILNTVDVVDIVS